MDQMKGFRVANVLYKKSLLNAIASAAALSIFFFGEWLLLVFAQYQR
jgi:hypothetical protein